MVMTRTQRPQFLDVFGFRHEEYTGGEFEMYFLQVISKYQVYKRSLEPKGLLKLYLSNACETQLSHSWILSHLLKTQLKSYVALWSTF